MKTFIRNLAILNGFIILLFILFPDIMKGVGMVYNGLGILPIVILLIIITAIPMRSRRR
jgi:hypothetical protein